jgi:hypothetical protein
VLLPHKIVFKEKRKKTEKKNAVLSRRTSAEPKGNGISPVRVAG